ncbi:MAG: DNA alkylation repair protein, partial [Acidobacteria bacterium]|nr:DNA alkylation repair protein [Acidobacteriota bacterium]
MRNARSAAWWSREAVRMLRAEADPRVAEQARSYFKDYDRAAFLGLRAPAVRAVEREIYRSVRPDWAFAEALRFCDTLIRKPHLEVKAVGILLLSRYAKSFARSLFSVARS